MTDWSILHEPPPSALDVSLGIKRKPFQKWTQWEAPVCRESLMRAGHTFAGWCSAQVPILCLFEPVWGLCVFIQNAFRSPFMAPGKGCPCHSRNSLSHRCLCCICFIVSEAHELMDMVDGEQNRNQSDAASPWLSPTLHRLAYATFNPWKPFHLRYADNFPNKKMRRMYTAFSNAVFFCVPMLLISPQRHFPPLE